MEKKINDFIVFCIEIFKEENKKGDKLVIKKILPKRDVNQFV